jgi:hypothetical protein
MVPSTFFWNGSKNSSFNQAANWTDASNPANHAVPGASDTAIIRSSPNDPFMKQAQTVGGLEVDSGLLTIGATLTDNGTFVQSGGSVTFGKNADRLTIAGDVTRTGGDFLNLGVGTVELNGTAGQLYAGRTYSRLPNTVISNTSAAGVTLLGDVPGGQGIGVFYGTNLTLNAGSKLTLTQNASAAFVWLSGNFIDNGTVSLSQLSPNGGSVTSLVHVAGALTLGSGSAFDLFVNPAVAGAVYYFALYGSVTGTATFNVTGNGSFAATPTLGPDALTVTLAATATAI